MNTIFNFIYLLECKYFETLSSQPSSLQVQMSYHVFAHQSDIPAVGYNWSEMPVSVAKRLLFVKL